MAWVPLQEWLPGYEPNFDTISAGSADFVDSTIVFTGVTNKSSGAFAYGFWYAYDIGGFIAGETVRVRVECTLADAGTYTAPSPPNVRLTGSSPPDIQTVWAGGVPATFDIELVNTADPQGQVDLWMQWGSGSGGTLFTGGNFEFRISVWMEDPLPPDPEPVGCFWTDLVNVTQDCGEAPEPVDMPSAFYGTYGRIIHFLDQSSERQWGMCSDDLFALLTDGDPPTDVWLTGYRLVSGNEPEGEVCELVVDAGAAWTDVLVQMPVQGDVNFGSYYYIPGGDPDLSEGLYAIRVVVLGETFYGYHYAVPI